MFKASTQTTVEFILTEFKNDSAPSTLYESSTIEIGDTIFVANHDSKTIVRIDRPMEIKNIRISGFLQYDLVIVNIPDLDKIILDTLYLVSYNNIQDGHFAPRKFLGIRIGKKWHLTGKVQNPVIKNKSLIVMTDNGKIVYRQTDEFELSVDYDKLINK